MSTPLQLTVAQPGLEDQDPHSRPDELVGVVEVLEHLQERPEEAVNRLHTLERFETDRTVEHDVG